MSSSTRWPDSLLDEMRLIGDPLADATVARLFSADPTLERANELLATLGRNQDLPDFPSDEVGDALRDFVTATSGLPDWANLGQISMAEDLFFEHGLLSTLCLFCASLPSCYVLADQAEVLFLAGQLEDHIERRLRETGRMIFPVMDSGGLAPAGKGIRQIQKVRLIHATIRFLITHGSAEGAPADGLGHALACHHWHEGDAVPINQEQIAFTLLTFGYVFIRSWPRLGIHVSREQQVAYLHCWNVVGHVIGLRRELMAETPEEAAELFDCIERRCIASPETVGPGRELASVLVNYMENLIPLRFFRPLPGVICTRLIGKKAATLLDIRRRPGPVQRFVFWVLLKILGAIEMLIRRVNNGYSVLRPIFRGLAHHLIKDYLLSQTRPLKLRDELCNAWGADSTNPRWLGWLETAVCGRESPLRKRPR